MLLSCLLAGIVYRRDIQRQGPAAGLLKVLMRAATLYALTVTVTLIFIVCSEVGGLLLAGSGLIYVPYQFFPDSLVWPWPIADNNLFAVAARDPARPAPV